VTDNASHPITLRRLEKLNSSIKQLLIDNNNYKKRLSNKEDPLIAKVRKLEAEIVGWKNIHYAQENVLANMEKKLANKKEADNAQQQETETAPRDAEAKQEQGI